MRAATIRFVGVILTATLFGCAGHSTRQQAAAAPQAEVIPGLSGFWRGEMGGTVVEEVWAGASETNMVGAMRWFGEEDEIRLYELLSIDRADSGVATLKLRHFNGDMNPWAIEDEGPMVFEHETGPVGVHRFRAVERGGSVVDLTYDLTVPDRLTTRLRFEDRETLVIEFVRID